MNKLSLLILFLFSILSAGAQEAEVKFNSLMDHFLSIEEYYIEADVKAFGIETNELLDQSIFIYAKSGEEYYSKILSHEEFITETMHLHIDNEKKIITIKNPATSYSSSFNMFLGLTQKQFDIKLEESSSIKEIFTFYFKDSDIPHSEWVFQDKKLSHLTLLNSGEVYYENEYISSKTTMKYIYKSQRKLPSLKDVLSIQNGKKTLSPSYISYELNDLTK